MKTVTIETTKRYKYRLMGNGKGIGGGDKQIESYKREKQLNDIRSETGLYLETTSRFLQEGM